MVSWTRKINISRARLRLIIWSRETCSAVPSRVSLLISILRLNLVLTYGIPPKFCDGVHLFTYLKPPYVIGSVPTLSGHAIAYRWRSLPRVRRPRASKPQGSSERGLLWHVTMDQLICVSLSHTHYWCYVGMLEVPAWIYSILILSGTVQSAVIISGLYTATLWKIEENGTVWEFHGFSNGAVYGI